LGLAKSGKMDEAVRVLSSQTNGSSWYGYGDWPNLDTFSILKELLDRKLISDLLATYVDLGRRLGRADEVDKQADAWLARSDLSSSDRLYLIGAKASIAAAEGRIDDAISGYEHGIESSEPSSTSQTASLTGELLSLASATGNTEAIAFVEKAAKSMGTQGSQLPFFDAYERMGRLADAQNAALASMTDTHDVNLEAEGQGRLLDAYPGIGVELASLYYRANEPEQILTLLHEFPKWGAGDLRDLLTQQGGGPGYQGEHGQPLGFYAAWAMAQTGRKDQAIDVLHALIPAVIAAQHPWASEGLPQDSAFELLNRLAGSNALSFYDGLIRGFALEARPLMWRGDLLLQMGKPQEAEKDVLAAIHLDPTDGKAAGGERQRAYEILGRILDAEGKADQAAGCRKIVEAARLAESAATADRAGLDSKAVALYEQALAANPEDCQARLGYAYLLNQEGRFAESTTQYSRAAALVLKNEGPVGGAGFNLWRATPGVEVIARSFTQLQPENPNNPGLFTCLGEIQESRGDYRASLDDFEKAVAADPKFVRAWHDIVGLGGKGVLTKKQAEQATLALVRLDPLAWYPSVPEEFGDFAALWRTCHQAWKSLYPLPSGSLLPLEASRRSLKSGARPAGEGVFVQIREEPPRLRDGPGAALGSLAELQALSP
ncbi:MAG TPA: hypothetical protein VMI31_07920, partial [Fimbriimonadaceae bacterium]|nr:hypothetical protein [Fimbriimonadaceae bacterium]